jgi:hypothetical protein
MGVTSNLDVSGLYDKRGSPQSGLVGDFHMIENLSECSFNFTAHIPPSAFQARHFHLSDAATLRGGLSYVQPPVRRLNYYIKSWSLLPNCSPSPLKISRQPLPHHPLRVTI